MSKDVEPTHTTALAIAAEQDSFTERQVAMLAHMGVEGAPEADLEVFFHVCKRSGLDPFARQIYMIGRPDRQAPGGMKYTIQTGIDGYRLIARRAANRSRHGMSIGAPEWCDENGHWRPVWSHTRWGHPLAARVTVTRDGQPYQAIANYDEYVQHRAGGVPTRMWATRPAGQLAKCAEALALRMAFPQDLSGIYTDEEMAQADNVHGPDHPASQRPALNAAALADDTDHAVVEGVVVDGPPGAPPAAAPDDERHQVMADLFELMQRVGPAEKDARVAYMSQVVGRDVTGSADLAVDEARQVCDALAADEEAAAAEETPDEAGNETQ